MKKILVVAEKPSVGRDIARTLRCSQKGDGFVYSDTYVVSWAIGHLVTLCEPDEYDPAWKRWSMETLPIIPQEVRLKPLPKTRGQLTVLKKLMNSQDIGSIICATDSGREGELIFRYIYQYVGCKKPFQRLWISSMTDAAIQDGFTALKDGAFYDSLYLSAKCRSEADWLVGINASRAFTLRYHVLLSIGRVQTPTLAILAQRQKEIDAFVSRDYWEVKSDLITQATAGAIGFSGLWFNPEDKETKIFEQAKAEAIAEKVRGKTGTVESLETERKKVPPKLLYDLTELQRDGNKLFGFSAQDTLSIAQDLYEKRKLITYPRTDSHYLSEDMIPKLKPTLSQLQQIETYAPFAAYCLALPKLPVTKRLVDNSKISDHHAIIPTQALVKFNALSPAEKKIYDLVARRFIAAFYPHYIFDITRVVSLVEDERFVSKGKQIIQLGWMELYPRGREENADAPDLPDVKKGDLLTVGDAVCLAKKTQPPKPYTEATLLSAMENAGRLTEDEAIKEKLKESGLGTPATRAAIIERLLTVGYVTREAKNLRPTEKGVKLIEIAPDELKSPETTGRWEKGLSQIAKAQMDPEKFMQSIVRYVQFLIDAARRSETSVVFPPEERKCASKPRRSR
jgi:DNA topoisomerase-3